MNQQSCLAGNLEGHVYRRKYLRRQPMIGTNADGLMVRLKPSYSPLPRR